jgi:UDP-glucose 4-epimerase
MKTPVFPMVNNQRSMLYIENLCEFVRLMIENDEQGTFWPQNAEYSNTSELVKMIAEAHEKKVYLVKGFGWALKIMSKVTGLVNKAFGSLSYEAGMSEYRVDYRTSTLVDSIRKTEMK